MNSHEHVDLLDPPVLARTLKLRATATQQACAAGTSATDEADATATRTALDAAEKCPCSGLNSLTTTRVM